MARPLPPLPSLHGGEFALAAGNAPEIGGVVNEIYLYALKLLRNRDYSISTLRRKLEIKFPDLPEDIIEELLRNNFLNDRRFAENYAARRKHRGAAVVREELLANGISAALADEVVTGTAWPSLRGAL